MSSKSKVSLSKKQRPSSLSKKFKVSKSGSKTTATKVADVDSLDLSDIVNAAHSSSLIKQKKGDNLNSLDVKVLKQDKKKDEEKKELETKQSLEAQSMIDQLDLM